MTPESALAISLLCIVLGLLLIDGVERLWALIKPIKRKGEMK